MRGLPTCNRQQERHGKLAHGARVQMLSLVGLPTSPFSCVCPSRRFCILFLELMTTITYRDPNSVQYMGILLYTRHCVSSRKIPLSLVTQDFPCLYSESLWSNPHSPQSPICISVSVPGLSPCCTLAAWVGQCDRWLCTHGSLCLALAGKKHQHQQERSSGQCTMRSPTSQCGLQFFVQHCVSLSPLFPVVCTQVTIFKNLIQTSGNSFTLLTDDFLKLQTVGWLPGCVTSLISLS